VAEILWAFPMFKCECKLVKQEGDGFRCMNCRRFHNELPLTKPTPTAPATVHQIGAAA
jgi:hypothetical protein